LVATKEPQLVQIEHTPGETGQRLVTSDTLYVVDSVTWHEVASTTTTGDPPEYYGSIDGEITPGRTAFRKATAFIVARMN
jgi:hypothetical protein